MSSCLFHARDCRVETPGNDSLRLQLQSFWTQLRKRVVNILHFRVVTCSGSRTSVPHYEREKQVILMPGTLLCVALCLQRLGRLLIKPGIVSATSTWLQAFHVAFLH